MQSDAEQLTYPQIFFDGRYRYSLNGRLIKQQNLSQDAVGKLIKLHQSKLQAFKDLSQNKTDQQRFALLELIEYLEFEMQAVWGFPMNRDRHGWYKVPGCTCVPPVKPLYIRVYSKTCKVHKGIK